MGERTVETDLTLHCFVPKILGWKQHLCYQAQANHSHSSGVMRTYIPLEDGINQGGWIGGWMASSLHVDDRQSQW